MLSSEVGHAADGWADDGGVWFSVMVVGVDPGGNSVGSYVSDGRSARGPFVEHGPVETFHFAVDLGLSGWDTDVVDPVGVEVVSVEMALVAGTVVGNDRLHCDALNEPRHGALGESGRGDALPPLSGGRGRGYHIITGPRRLGDVSNPSRTGNMGVPITAWQVAHMCRYGRVSDSRDNRWVAG